MSTILERLISILIAIVNGISEAFELYFVDDNQHDNYKVVNKTFKMKL